MAAVTAAVRCRFCRKRRGWLLLSALRRSSFNKKLEPILACIHVMVARVPLAGVSTEIKIVPHRRSREWQEPASELLLAGGEVAEYEILYVYDDTNPINELCIKSAGQRAIKLHEVRLFT